MAKHTFKKENNLLLHILHEIYFLHTFFCFSFTLGYLPVQTGPHPVVTGPHPDENVRQLFL